MKRERTDRWTKMRLSRARFSGTAASCHMLFSVDCITTTFESEFSVHTATSESIVPLSFESSTTACITARRLHGDLGLRTAHQDCSGSWRPQGDSDRAPFPELPMTSYRGVRHPRSELDFGTSKRDCLGSLQHRDDRGQVPFPGLRMTSYTAVQHPDSDLDSGTEQRDC
jgi:hypothetical protein